MFPRDQAERRRSFNTLSTGDKWRPRSASAGVVDISPLSRSFSSQYGPVTPCFVSPRMAFTTQFDYDSPIQVLTSRSPCVFKPMSAPPMPGRCSLKTIPHRYKILLTILLLFLSACLYFNRNLKGIKMADCKSGDTCDDFSYHPLLKRFMEAETEQQQHHTLTADLENPDVELPPFYGSVSDSQNFAENYMGSGESNDLLSSAIAPYEHSNLAGVEENVQNEDPSVMGNGNLEQDSGYNFVPDEQLMDTHEGSDYSPDKPQNENVLHEQQQSANGFGKLGATDSLGENGVKEERYHRKPYLMERELSYSHHAQEPEIPRTKRHSRSADMDVPWAARPRHQEFNPIYTRGDSRRSGMEDFRSSNRREDGLRMDRLPPGINPRRYKTEF